MKLHFFSFFLIISLSFIFLNSLNACSCTPGARLVKDEVKRSSFVAIGKIVSIEKISTDVEMVEEDSESKRSISVKKVKIQIETFFKGKKGNKEITIYTGMGKGDCGFHFKINEKYVIYVNKNASFFPRNGIEPEEFKNTLWTDICTRTKLVNHEEVAELNKIKAVKNK